MHQATAEVLILAITALGAGILLFIARVLQPVMDGMEEPQFKRFATALVQTAMSDPLTVMVATLPIMAAVLYFAAYGFKDAWFTAGLVVWLVGSSLTKIINMPVYKWLADPENDDPVELSMQRQRLRLGNTLRAGVTFAAVILMAFQFGMLEAALVATLGVVMAFPLTEWAGKYIPGREPS